ncbi:MAG: hypothetical protein PWQ89_896 [Verrucomicrobiota bacterium]|jgi:hypothetical protein|nr:hypothetical protein [Verrucomicrobiota bacterium]
MPHSPSSEQGRWKSFRILPTHNFAGPNSGPHEPMLRLMFNVLNLSARYEPYTT